ncbi:MAG: ABC transporter permease [Bacteroidota bacterium]
MFKNYLLVAIRNIFRNKLFSGVNILGLAFGIGSALLIFLWVNDELRVDKFHARVDRIYRVMENQQYTDGRLFTFASTPGPMAPFIKDKYPEIVLASRFTWPVNELFQVDDKSFFEEGRYAEQDFLDMFSFSLASGDIATSLKNKNSIVISKAMAEKFFGKEDPVGKVLLMNTKHSFTVTGVLNPLPKNSSLQFEYILPFQFFWDENISWLDQWDNNNIRTYVMLEEGANVTDFGNKFENELKEHVEKTETKLFIQPFGDTYLYGDFENGKQAGGRIESVRIFLIVAAFVLIIACINFMNLATAQASKRAKEVGLRKVIGAFPHQLFRQFMGESFFTVLVSSAIAILLVMIALPGFNELTSKNLGLFLLDVRVILIFVGIILFTAFLAGSYPAIFISDYKPVEVLKGQLKSGSKASVFRKLLVVAQFSISIVLIISTIVVFRQMNFMEKKDIGFVRDNVFYMFMQGDMNKNFEVMRNQLLADPAIESVSASSQLPIEIGNSTTGVSWEGKGEDEKILFANLDVDYDFIGMMKMEMVEGRAFDRNIVTDSTNYIVNEKAAAKFGFKNGTADQDLTMWERKGKIIGVVKDFNFGSLNNPIEPLILRIPRLNQQYYGSVLIRAKENQTAGALKAAEKATKDFAAAYPFRYSFLNQDWEDMYKSEARQGKLFNVLAALSIFISCLGLFGLSAFSAERRTKELGIRKVLGASRPGLVGLMGKEFAVLVLIAAVVGCPVGWYFMDQWLSGYAFHVEVGWVSLALAASACLSVSLLTVAYHSLKVSAANPANSLRYE